jgi:DNA-binding XRE family transcriptional regulator
LEYSLLEYANYEYKSQVIFLMPKIPKIDLAAIGSRIKELRGAMRQEELAALLHITQGHLSKIESGKIAPSIEILVFLSLKFGRPTDWILRGET